jgi:uncharacterized protein (DUF1330 family)
MPAYVISGSLVSDAEGMAEYRRLVGETIEKYGGKRLLRTRRIETLEGAWEPEGITVLEFENVERLREWYNSPEYAELKALRQRSADSTLLVVEGL